MATLVYIDETGTVDLRDSAQPLLTLVGVLVDDTQARPLSESLREIASGVLDDVPDGFEFHGVDLWHENRWWTTLDCAAAIETYREALALLAHHEISIVHSTIHKPNLRRRYSTPDSPYLLALQFLCEKLDTVKTDSLKILVADESKEHDLSAVEMVSEMQEWGSGAIRGRQLRTIIDSLHFVRSEASPGVQMADLVGFVIQRCRRGRESHAVATAALEEFAATIKDARITFRDIWPWQ